MRCLALLPLCLVAVMAKDCVQTLIDEPKASTLVKYVVQANLAGALKSGTLTIFAPSDAAFNRVDPATLQALEADPAALTSLLQFHVVQGKVMSTDIQNEMKAASLAGDQIRLNVYSHNKAVTAQGAKVTTADVTCDNGVIHFVDHVMMPATKTVVQIVADDPELSTLLTAMTKAGIANEFQKENMTLFAPTNAAFAKIAADDLNRLLANQRYLENTLEYHALPETDYSAGLYNREREVTIDDRSDRLQIRIEAGVVRINGYATVSTADISAKNGVVHKIDSVLMPSWVYASFAFGKK